MRFLKQESGQDLVEYALLIVVVGLGLILAARFLAESVQSVYSEAAMQIADSLSASR